MKTRHKWLLAMALLISIAAWLAWTLLTAESDVAPQGRTPTRPLIAAV
jgi:multisubunit Na+/H+ antiporter MnhE subunit